MSNQHDEHNEHARHFYVTPAVLPQPDATDTEWIQRVAMLGELGESLCKTIYWTLRINAPILVDPDSMLYQLIAGLGLTLRGIAATGTQQLAKRGLRPISLEEDQLRIIRDEIARPGVNAELREALLAVLAINLQATANQPSPADDEWPAEGIILTSDD